MHYCGSWKETLTVRLRQMWRCRQLEGKTQIELNMYPSWQQLLNGTRKYCTLWQWKAVITSAAGVSSKIVASIAKQPVHPTTCRPGLAKNAWLDRGGRPAAHRKSSGENHSSLWTDWTRLVAAQMGHNRINAEIRQRKTYFHKSSRKFGESLIFNKKYKRKEICRRFQKRSS